jgi:hypothetical protein
MKLLIKMLGLGLLVAAAITYDRSRLRRAGRLDAGFTGAFPDPGFPGADLAGVGSSGDDLGVADIEIITESVIVGLADVDPEPLAGMGEGIDPDAVEEAHRSVKEQREGLPISGKNVP